jgi:hypothetical protein
MYRAALRAFLAQLQTHEFTDEQLAQAGAAWIDSIGNRSSASDLEDVARDQIAQRDLFTSSLGHDPAETGQPSEWLLELYGWNHCDQCSERHNPASPCP